MVGIFSLSPLSYPILFRDPRGEDSGQSTERAFLFTPGVICVSAPLDAIGKVVLSLIGQEKATVNVAAPAKPDGESTLVLVRQSR